MLKNFAMIMLLTGLSFLLFGCNSLGIGDVPGLTEYQIWRNSEFAEDLNGDRKIDELDYELYLIQNDYEAWRNSDFAEDLNGDRKIDELDYELFLNPPLSDYEIWKNSDDAIDLNDDGKIDELDYELYLNPILSDYEIWRNSEFAEDLNGDRKIDELDYELYLNPPLSDYEIWKASDKASDINNDGKIDELDYAIYLEYSEFAGYYQISNFTYEGKNLKVGKQNDIESIGFHLSQILISVDNNGDIDAYIPMGTMIALDDIYTTLLEGLNNMTLKRISPFIVAMDTRVIVETVPLNATIYLIQNENGFSASYNIDYNGLTSKISFDLTKLQNQSLVDYDNWKVSSHASDLNDDGKIDELDYEIFLQFNEIAGNYQILNYVYVGHNLTVGEQNDLESIGQLLKQVLFTVNENGHVSTYIPNTTKDSLGDIYDIVIEGLDNLTLKKISQSVFVFDTYVTINNLDVQFTLYLSQTINGFTTSYTMEYNGLTAVISFDIVRIK